MSSFESWNIDDEGMRVGSDVSRGLKPLESVDEASSLSPVATCARDAVPHCPAVKPEHLTLDKWLYSLIILIWP